MSARCVCPSAGITRQVQSVGLSTEALSARCHPAPVFDCACILAAWEAAVNHSVLSKTICSAANGANSHEFFAFIRGKKRGRRLPVLFVNNH